jgi:DNA-binding NarL/FixJ family response regulator
VSLGGTPLFALRIPLRQLPAVGRLTDAERDVLLRLVRGGSHGSIARVRGVSVRTLSNQVGSIFEKLGVHSRAELARLLADVDLGAQGVLLRSQPRRAQYDGGARVLVAEDHLPLLEELAADLARAGLEVERARSLAEVRSALAAQRFGAALLDVRLGDESAIDVLRAGDPPCPVVLSSGAADLDEAVEGLVLGAHEFVEKSAGPDVLRVAIGDAIASGPPPTKASWPTLPPTILEPGEAGVVVDGLIRGQLRFVGTLDYGARHHLFAADGEGLPLTDRQRIVVSRLVHGVSLKDVAAELEIVSPTLFGHMARAFDALGMRDRTSLTSILAPIAPLWPAERQ